MLNWNRLSLRNQFLLIFVFIQILVLGFLFFYLNHNLIQFYYNQLKLNLLHESKLIINNDKIDLNIHTPEEIDRWIKELGKKIDTRITIISYDGTVLADSESNPIKMDNHKDRPEIRSVLAGKELDSLIRMSKTLNMDMYYLAYPIKKNEEIIGVIRLAKPLKAINEVINRNNRNYFLFFVVLLIFTSFLAWRFSASIIGPLKMITQVSGKIAHGKFHERIKLKSYENEIGTMARMFNYMASQLEHKIAETSEEKSRAEAILTSMVDGVIATDIDRKIIIINPTAKKMLALPEKIVKGKELIEVIRHHRIDLLLQKALKNNNILSEEIVFQKAEKKIFLCHFVPITNERELVIGGVIVFTDITELRRLEQVRTEFVANVSHELRTPLTSIIGYVDTLLESDIEDPATSRRFLKIIKTEADRLALLIGDLLDLSKLEAKAYQANLYPNDLIRIIEKTRLILADKAQDKEIMLKKEVQENLPLVLMIPEQIEQVLINLVDNGIKYTPEGGKVIIRAFIEKDKVVVEVEDNGIGIPKEDQERIFERFYRVDKARSRALGGTGIGLSIVKHIIQSHNSKIEIKSELRKGTVFRFYLEKV